METKRIRQINFWWLLQYTFFSSIYVSCVFGFWKRLGNKRKTETFSFFLLKRKTKRLTPTSLPKHDISSLKKFCGRNSPNSSCKTPPMTSQKRFPTSKLKARTERRLETVFLFFVLRGASNWPQGWISLLLFSSR